MSPKITENKTRKGKYDKEADRSRIELPALTIHATVAAILKKEGCDAHEKIEKHQFGEAPAETLASTARHAQDEKNSLEHKWKIRGEKSRRENQPSA